MPVRDQRIWMLYGQMKFWWCTNFLFKERLHHWKKNGHNSHSFCLYLKKKKEEKKSVCRELETQCSKFFSLKNII